MVLEGFGQGAEVLSPELRLHILPALAAAARQRPRIQQTWSMRTTLLPSIFRNIGCFCELGSSCWVSIKVRALVFGCYSRAPDLGPDFWRLTYTSCPKVSQIYKDHIPHPTIAPLRYGDHISL